MLALALKVMYLTIYYLLELKQIFEPFMALVSSTNKKRIMIILLCLLYRNFVIPKGNK